MKVTLMSYTPDAMDLLLRTKNTRLTNKEDPTTWSAEKKQANIDYMRDTIRSSWEFVDYTFLIEGVTRNFTHQLVRTRSASYAQQSMRATDMRGFEALTPAEVSEFARRELLWDLAIVESRNAYSALVDDGVPEQDARGILPTNVLTDIFGKFDLRTMASMAEVRLCTRTQGEYQDVFREMRRLVIEVHPWTEDFINVHCVAHGTCAFPRYGKRECPIWNHGIGETHEKIESERQFVKEAWQTIRFESKVTR